MDFRRANFEVSGFQGMCGSCSARSSRQKDTWTAEVAEWNEVLAGFVGGMKDLLGGGKDVESAITAKIQPSSGIGSRPSRLSTPTLCRLSVSKIPLRFHAAGGAALGAYAPLSWRRTTRP